MKKHKLKFMTSKNSFILILISIYLINFGNLKSQGCSDAGVCSLDMSNSHSLSDSLTFHSTHSIRGSFGYGLADYNINIIQSSLEYIYSSNSFQHNIKLNTLSQIGKETSTFGLGDVILTSQYKFDNNIVSFGFKIPLTDGNNTISLENQNISLPMDYQTSLGTYDLIFGFAKQFDNLGINLIYQLPIIQNKNKFYNSSSEIFNDFITTNQYSRASDLVLRLSYKYDYNENIQITPSLLPIYHLSNDKRLNIVSDMLINEEIAGSKGLTLNLNLNLDYKLDSDNFGVNLGFPVLVRDVRPDGLTRAFVLNISYLKSI